MNTTQIKIYTPIEVKYMIYVYINISSIIKFLVIRLSENLQAIQTFPRNQKYYFTF
jgi:hypothetical protein